MKNTFLTLLLLSTVLTISCKDDRKNSNNNSTNGSKEKTESNFESTSHKKTLETYTYHGLTLNFSKGISLEAVKPTIVRTKKAIDYFNKYISDEKISVTVNVLSREDWSDYTNVRPYGMPHASGKASLTMAFEDNEFWKGTIPPEGSISQEKMEKFKQIYSDANGKINMKIFFDFLAIHELGHLLEAQSGVNLPKPWLQEFYANYFLHGYVATIEPENLDILTLSPNVNIEILSDVKYKTLQEFEDNYGNRMEAINYAWYQSRYHQIAREVYDKVGNKGIAKLFQKFKGYSQKPNNKELIDFLEKDVNPETANAFRNF